MDYCHCKIAQFVSKGLSTLSEWHVVALVRLPVDCH